MSMEACKSSGGTNADLLQAGQVNRYREAEVAITLPTLFIHSACSVGASTTLDNLDMLALDE
jgi:hypothetical protein